jgi:peptidyl-Lys metalloendopeptidase
MFGAALARCALLALACLVPSIAFAQLDVIGGGRLTIRLQFPEGRLPQFGRNEPIVVQFRVTNSSPVPVRVLRWRLPLEGNVTENIFAVTAGGPGRPSVNYIGPIVKRGTPRPEDFLELAPGQSQQATVNLADYYAIEQKNEYSVTFRPSVAITPQGRATPSIIAGAFTGLRKVAVESNTLGFAVTEERQVAPKFVPPSTAPGFSGCTAGQQSDLTAAVSVAQSIAASAANLLKTTPPGQQPRAQRYTTWFGSHTRNRYAMVSSHFDKIEDALKTKLTAFMCGGKECAVNVFAYVSPTQPYRIYICQAFWNAAVVGTDSRSGTLVHEMSHFDVVAGTDDIVYGQSGAQDLAMSSPDDAIDNADNHEYFSENTPNLPM